MKIRKYQSNMFSRLLPKSELCAYLGLGEATAVKFAREHGAVIRIGKRCLFDKAIIDSALDYLNGGGASA